MCEEVQNLHARFSPKNTKTLEPLSRGLNIMYPCKQPVKIHYSIAFTVSFYCFLLSGYLGLIAVHDL